MPAQRHVYTSESVTEGHPDKIADQIRSEEHTSELQSRSDLVCRLLLEKKKKNSHTITQSELTRKMEASNTIWAYLKRDRTASSARTPLCLQNCAKGYTPASSIAHVSRL